MAIMIPWQPWQGCRSAIIHEHKSDPTLTLTLLERACPLTPTQFQQHPQSSTHTRGRESACLERRYLWVPQASGGVVYAESAGSSSIYIRVEQSSFTGNFVSGIRVRARTDSVAPMALSHVCVQAAPTAIDRTCPRDAAVERVAAVSFALAPSTQAHNSPRSPSGIRRSDKPE